MSSKSKKRGGTFVYKELFTSEAFIALGGAAPQVLINFLGKRKMEKNKRRGNGSWVCTNCNKLTFTYVEAKKELGIENSRFTRAIEQLLAKGFITIKYRGGAYKKDQSVYGLTDKWQLWKEGMVFERREKESVQRGGAKPKRKATCEVVPLHGNENEPQAEHFQQRNRSHAK